MKFEKFSDGKHFTLGMELELRILNSFDLTPCNEFDYIYSNIDEKYKKNLAQEFLGSMLEINSPICDKEEQLIEFLKNIIKNLNKIAQKRDLIFQTSGSFAQKNCNMKINKTKRYKELYDEHKILLDEFSICGTHVHIGFEDSNKALKAYNYSIYYLPLFLALSASSVFYDNVNTGIHSYRTKIFDRLPKASIPEYFDTIDEMKELYEFLYETKVIKSTKDIWWDVRIQPHFKTLEFRICDAINDFDRLEVILGLLKAICQLSQIDKTIKMPMQVLKQNMWSATRYSMDGNMVTNKGRIPIREMLYNLLQKIEENSLLTEEFINKAKKIIDKKSIAQEMIEIYKKTNSLKEVERLGVFK